MRSKNAMGFDKRAIPLPTVILGICCALIPSPVRSTEDNCSRAKQLLEQAKIAETQREDIYRKAIKLCPSLAEAHALMADLLEAQGKLPEAINSMAEAHRIDPDENLYKQALSRMQGSAAEQIARQLSSPSQPRMRGNKTRSIGTVEEFAPQGYEPKLDLPILFKFDSAELEAAAIYNLDALAKALNGRELAERNFVIRGHTDNVGSAEYNLKLSFRRAASVRDFLIQQGAVSSARLSAEGAGMAEPVQSNETDAGREANRRVEIRRKPMP